MRDKNRLFYFLLDNELSKILLFLEQQYKNDVISNEEFYIIKEKIFDLKKFVYKGEMK